MLSKVKVTEIRQTTHPDLLELRVEPLTTDNQVCSMNRGLNQIYITRQERIQKDVRFADVLEIALAADGRPYVQGVVLFYRNLEPFASESFKHQPESRCKSCVHLQALKEVKPEYSLENIDELAYEISDLADEMNLLSDYLLCYYADDTKDTLEIGGVYAMSIRLPKQVKETLDKLEGVAGDTWKRVAYKKA